MKVITPILTSLIVGLWASAIAILSVQNATLISLKFLAFQSIQLPIGLILAFSFSVGVIVAALLQPISNSIYSQEQQKSHKHQEL